MKTYRITAIKRKAKRLGAGYLCDCRALAESWDEAADEAVFSDAAVAEIKATWEPKTIKHYKPCGTCGGR